MSLSRSGMMMGVDENENLCKNRWIDNNKSFKLKQEYE